MSLKALFKIVKKKMYFALKSGPYKQQFVANDMLTIENTGFKKKKKKNVTC